MQSVSVEVEAVVAVPVNVFLAEESFEDAVIVVQASTNEFGNNFSLAIAQLGVNKLELRGIANLTSEGTTGLKRIKTITNGMVRSGQRQSARCRLVHERRRIKHVHSRDVQMPFCRNCFQSCQR